MERASTETKKKRRRIIEQENPIQSINTPKRDKGHQICPFSSPWQYTETCSIVDAIQQYRKSENSSSRTPLDIVAAVLSVSVNLARQTAELLVTDPSLVTLARCARIRLKGTAVVSPLLEQNVARGTVIRVNRLVVKSETFKEEKSTTTTTFQQLHIVCELGHDWRQPEAGILWKQLCCIRDGVVVHPDDVVPANMATQPQKVQSLVTWFTRQQQPAASYSVKPSTRLRRLGDISTAGLVSHVVVKVLSCDVSNMTSPRKKSRRFIQTNTRSIVAMLSDGPNDADLMGLHDCKLSWEGVLKRAVKQKERVRVTNLQSVARNGHIVLVPTPESIMIQLGSTKECRPPLNPQTLSETQQPLSLLPDDYQHSKSVVSPLMDVYVDALDVSLGDVKRWSRPTDLCSILIDSARRSPQYRHATLTLKDKSGLFAVHADPTILETLCGSVNAKLLMQQVELQAHVFELMSGLLEEETCLEWTLTRVAVSETFNVVTVKLPIL